MSESVVIETPKRKISAIWVVPVVALVLGVWLAVDAYLKQGPTITSIRDSFSRLWNEVSSCCNER